jgi:hypothetical protein
MLEIVSNRGSFSLAPEYKADFEQSFSLADFEESRDLKSQSFTIPKNPENVALVEEFAPLDAPRQSNFSLEVELLLFGEVWSYGQLYFLDEDEDFYEVSFTGELSRLLNAIEDLNVREIDYLDPVITDMYFHAETILANPGNYDYVFAPVDLPSLEGDFWWPAQCNSVVFNANGSFNRYVEFWRHFDYEDFDPDRVKVANAGGPDLMYSVGEAFKFDGLFYQVTSNMFTGDTPNGNPGKVSQLTLGNVKRYNPMVPFFYVLKIFDRISSALGVKFSGSILQDSEIERLVFFNTVCLNSMEDNAPGTVLTGTAVRYANHLPDQTVRSLLIDFCTWFNLKMEYRVIDNTLTFTQREAVLNTPIHTELKKRVLKLETIYREKRTYNLAYSYRQEDVNLASAGWQETLNGVDGEKGSIDIVADYSTLPMRYGYNEVDPDWKEFPADSPIDESYYADYWRPVSSLGLNAEVPKQWLFFRGFHEYEYPPAGASNVPEIPLVSSNLDYVNSNGVDSYTCYWQGTGGLYAVWWSKYLYALSLGKVLRAFVLFNGGSWNVASLKERQLLFEYVCIIEKLKLSAGRNTHEIVAELEVLKL